MQPNPEGENKGPQPNPMIEAAKKQTLETGGPHVEETSSLGITLGLVEKGGVPEALKNPELAESLDEIESEMTRTLFEPIVLYVHDARTGFVNADWQMNSTRLQVEGLEQTIKTKSSIHRPYRPEKVQNDSERKAQVEAAKHIHEIYQSRVKEEVTRLASFGHIMADGMGPMGVYFDGHTMMGVNQRRLIATPTDRYRLAFGRHNDKELNKYKVIVDKKKLHEQAQMALPDNQKTPPPFTEEEKKIFIENAPKFFEEGFSDLVKEDAARMHDIVNVLSEMNKRNPFAGRDNEMRIKELVRDESGNVIGSNLTITEQEFLGELFQKVPRTDEHGNKNKKDLEDDKTRKIKVYVDRDGHQYSQDKDGDPVDKEGNKIDLSKNKEIVEREFYINLLTYENTTSSEVEHKRFISLLMAYTMLKDPKTGLGVRETLQEIIKRSPGLTLGLTDAEIQKLPFEQQEDYKRLEGLVARVGETARDLVDDWDSPRVRDEREAAAAAFELNFMLECATLQIANIGHWYHWEKVMNLDKDGKETGLYSYKFLDEIGDPDMAFDAMTAMFTMQHEYTYSAIKNRVSTPLLPPVDPAFAEKIINFVVQGGRDPEIEEYARKDEYIARFYGIVGLFPHLKEDKIAGKAWQEGEVIRLRQKRSDGSQIECSDEFLQCLEQTMFGIPTVYNDKIFPIPMAPFFNLTLFDSMHVSKDKTVQDLLNERQLLTEIDFGQQHPFASDGRMVSGRFITDMTYIMYGAADVKGLHGFFASPFEAIRKIVKSLDIGARNSVRLIDFIKNRGKLDNTGKNIQEEPTKISINKKFHEITYVSYMLMAYLAFIKFDMFSGGKKWESHRNEFLNLHEPFDREKNPDKAGAADFLEAISYQLRTKQGYQHYGDAMYLLFIGLKEVIEGISKEADKYYKDKVAPAYTFNQPGSQDPLKLKENTNYKTP